MKKLNIFQKAFRSTVQDQVSSPNYKNPQLNEEGRGYTVYFTSQMQNEYAKDRYGHDIVASRDDPYFLLTPDQRVRITQSCSMVLGIVTSRMNRISARKFNIVSDREQEDLIVDKFRDINNLIKEYANALEPAYIIAKARLTNFLRSKLIELNPDLSNFDACLLRWSKNNKQQTKSKADSIKSWLEQPNQNDTWEDFIKQWVFDEMIQGSVAIYKQTTNNRLDNMCVLAGGTTLPIRDLFVTSKTGYLQIVPNQTPQIFYTDELIYSRYIPISSRSYGLVPLEALINKITESLFFDKLMADQADGTKLPEKMIVVTDNNPFGKMDDTFKLPINKGEQKRIEKKINTPIKGGVMTFSGNTATVVDLTRENTMATQMQRQKDLREDIAQVFNMSNMEVNLTGGEDTSGRSTSESQGEIEEGKGTLPMMAEIENRMTKEAIIYRGLGSGYRLEFQAEESETKELERLRLKYSTGLFSLNEIRIKDLNLNPFDNEQFNEPPSAQQQPMGSEVNPFNMRSME